MLTSIFSLLNWLAGMLAALGLPCLIIGIILIIRNKSKAAKTRWIILVCFIPASILIYFISSIMRWSIYKNSYENQLNQWVHQLNQNQELQQQNNTVNWRENWREN